MSLRHLIALGACVLASCAPTVHKVTYKVIGDPDWPTTDGTGPWAHVAIQNDNGGSEQHDVQTPYSLDLTVPRGAFVYVSAQAKEGDQVVCEIYDDGVLMKRSESDGEFAIATCSGTA